MTRFLAAASVAALMVTGPALSQTAETATPPALPEQTTVMPPPLPVAEPEVAKYFVDENGTAGGPYTATEMGDLIASGVLGVTTLVWMEGMDAWQNAGLVPEVAALMAGTAMDTATDTATGALDTASEAVSGAADAIADAIDGQDTAAETDIATQIVGSWTQNSIVPIEGMGMGQANITVTFDTEMGYAMDGVVNVQMNGSPVEIVIGGTGDYAVDGIDDAMFDMTMNGTVSMAIPSMNIPETPEGLNETTRYELVDANTLRDVETGDMLTRAQP